MSSVSPRANQIVTIPIYLTTVVIHLSLFISSGSRKREVLDLSVGPKGAGVAFLLSLLWCGFVLANISIRIPRFQKGISGVFGVAESLVVAYIAVQHIIESLSPAERLHVD